MSDQPEKTKEQKQKEDKAAKETAKFLMNLVLFGGSSLVTKMAWNIGLSGLFPRLPSISYGQAVSWLLLLYIASRVVAAGWMAEIEKSAATALETIEETVNKVVSAVGGSIKPPTDNRTDNNVN